MPTPPPANVIAAFVGPTSKLIRRCEIFESDAVTPWRGAGTTSRLIEGSVGIDFSRDERRSLEATLDNFDGALRHDPDGFWYDKIIKAYYGIEYYDTTPIATSTVRTNLCTNPNFETNLAGWTAENGATLIRETASPISGTGSGTISGGSGDVYIWGGPVSPGETITASLSYKTFGTTTGSAARFGVDTPQETNSTHYITLPVTQTSPGRFSVTAVADASGTILVYLYSPGGGSICIDNVLIERSSYAGAYFDGSMSPSSNVTFAWTGTANASTSTQTIVGTIEQNTKKIWECQIGEFMIDRLESSNFPPTIKMTCRDYTKKCLVSSFVAPTSFAKGSAIETVIKVLALNAGISKFLLPTTGQITGTIYSFERGASRWEAMKEISNAFGYDIYFDAQGYLTLTKYQDPVFAPLAYTLQTGPIFGNLVKFNKSTNDSRLFNHVVVTGESSDTTVIPVFAEAKNTEPSSPSRIARLGDRVNQITSAFVTTVPQAQTMATNFLRVSALEEYDVNFESIALPWLEVGNIILFLDPDAIASDPTRFLFSSLNISMGLGPMSGVAKRVGIVG